MLKCLTIQQILVVNLVHKVKYVLVLQYQEYTFSPVLCSYLSTTLCLFYCTHARILVYTLIQGLCAHTGTCIGIIVYSLQVWYYCITTIFVY